MSQTRPKLGEMLVDAGLANRLDIDHAIQAQQIFGDRLGTNLVELGILDEEMLATFLEKQFKVPRATREEMENIPTEILSLIPSKAAARLCLLPLRKTDDGKLLVAMMDPSDERVANRISQNVGMPIESRVATEIEIRYRLEKYYGVPRDKRQILLMKQTMDRKEPLEMAPKTVNILAAQLDRHISRADAIAYFFEKIKTLDKVPSQNPVGDLTEYDLTPELTFILFQVDGFTTLREILMASVYPRITTLRALVYFDRLNLIQIEDAF